MQWTSEKCLTQESLSNLRNSLWYNGFFWYQVHESTKAFQRFSIIRLWIILFPRRVLQRHKYKNLDSWIQKHVLISVFISSSLVEEPFFLFNSDPHHVVAPFIGAHANLGPQSQTKLKTLFQNIETTIKKNLGSVLEKLNRRLNWRKQATRFDTNKDDC